MDELVTNPSDGLVYKKFTSDPFTGFTTPSSENPSKGSYKKGKKHGVWETFHDNGLLETKGTYKDKEKHGVWKYFNEDGFWERTDTYKNGVKQ